MKPIVVDEHLIAYCGLYCGACGAYLRGRCPGCRDHAKARWCRVRRCCLQNQLSSCATCAGYANPKDCPDYGTVLSKLIGFLFRSDRAAGVQRLRQVGAPTYAQEMALLRRPAPRR